VKGLSEFDSEVIADKSIQNCTHDKNGLTTQKRFQERVKSLACAIEDLVNPFDFLTNKLRIMSVTENKEIFVTSGDDVFDKGTEHGMSQCYHEETDTRVIIHVQDSFQRGSNTIMV